MLVEGSTSQSRAAMNGKLPVTPRSAIMVGDPSNVYPRPCAGGQPVGGDAGTLVGCRGGHARVVAGHDRVDRLGQSGIAGVRDDRLGGGGGVVDLAGMKSRPARGGVWTPRGSARRTGLDGCRGTRLGPCAQALQVVVEEALDRVREKGLVTGLVGRALVTEVSVEKRDRVGGIERAIEVVVAERLVDREQVVGEPIGDQQRGRCLMRSAKGSVEQVVRRVVLRDLLARSAPSQDSSRRARRN